MNAIRVLIVDDHPRVRRGLRSLLSSCDDIAVVGEAEDGAGAIDAARAVRPDVILLDVKLPGPNGLEVAYQLRQLDRDVKTIILTAYDHDEYVVSALRAGARAYLLKSASDDSVVDAVRRVHRGERLLSPPLVDKVLREFECMSKAFARTQTDLSDQELKILALMTDGRSDREISEEMFLSERTIRRKVVDAKNKLGATTRAQLVAEAMKLGLI